MVATGVLSCLVLVACQNTVQVPLDLLKQDESPSPEDSENKTGLFQCVDPNLQSETAVRRLSKEEIRNSLIDFFSERMDESFVEPIMLALSPKLEALPSEILPFSVQETDSAFLSPYLFLASEIATLFGSSAGPISLMGLYCPKTSQEEWESCFYPALRDLSLRLWRKNLTVMEIIEIFPELNFDEPYVERTALMFLFASPDFNLVIEEGVNTGGNLRQLSKMEFITRFSLASRRAIPDQAMIEASVDLDLSSDQSIKEFIEQQFDDPRSLRSVRSFVYDLIDKDSKSNSVVFTDDQLNLAAHKFGFVAEDLEVLVEDAEAELDTYIERAFENNFSVRDIYTSRALTLDSEVLRSIYGTGSSNQKPEDLQGLTGLAFLNYSGGDQTRPIGRGTRFLREFLCTEPGDPVNANVDGAALIVGSDRENFSTIELSQMATNEPSCMSCHQSINSAGFTFERIGAFGELRSIEVVLDDAAQVLAEHELQVDETVALGQLDPQQVSRPSEMIDYALSSGQIQSCFSQKLFENQHRKSLSLTEDACSLQTIYDFATDDQKGIKDIFIDYYRTESFRKLRKTL